ncbi:AraC-like DNA-binding protein [Paenibacillus mucilaginosus]|uniref:helix-turn-helix transcriptional regulator n=1 Tax=Paenibacillus mucilaginosus TaxID=61624 RepID=UPI003D1CDDC4
MNPAIILTADRFPLVRDIGWNRTDSLYSHPDRVLDYHVFLYVSRGSMQVIEEDTAFVVREREFLFLHKGLHHWGQPSTPPGTEWYWIHFNTVPEEQADYKEHPPLPGIEYYAPDHYRYRISLPKYGTAEPGTEERLASMFTGLQEAGSHRMTRASLSVYSFLLDLHTSASRSANGAMGSGARLAERVMAYLTARIEEPFDGAKLAAYLNMNYSYVSSSFSKATGQSIIEAHTRLKLNEAVKLIRHSTLNIAEISERLGYQNPFYFSRVFKKTFGEPPSAYARQFYQPQRQEKDRE